ncbi:SDR family oxidoreductase [uncultured Nevskia sp.]|uniref:SDR family NAD(P)-dependent oxidoreductase n=1 Tax=uncultured Nevskia sp. TaxID=228950 RepID=UPI0025E3F6DF|nr:SDR family NAD(P)-dependent oxidoreductase [uncultured Nevskia sp.]
MKSFANKVAAITGAASGMGRELALELAARGCALSLSDVNTKGLEETAKLAKAKGVKVTTAKLDVASREAVYDWAEQTAKDHGGVNLIFNNAGVALNAPLDTISQKDFEWIVDINFWGVVYGSQAFLPHLKASGDGHIINTSSLFGLIGTPGTGAYSATKFAVRGYTESLRIELDMMNCGVSATCVHPGGIRTEINRSARIAEGTEKLFGVSGEKARDKFDKLLNTTSANKAARIILRAVEKNSRRVVVGPDAKFMDIIVRLLGSAYQPLIAANTKRMLR